RDTAFKRRVEWGDGEEHPSPDQRLPSSSGQRGAGDGRAAHQIRCLGAWPVHARSDRGGAGWSPSPEWLPAELELYRILGICRARPLRNEKTVPKGGDRNSLQVRELFVTFGIFRLVAVRFEPCEEVRKFDEILPSLPLFRGNAVKNK